MKAVAKLLFACLLFVGGGYAQWKYGEPVIETYDTTTTQIVEVPVITTEVVEVPRIVIETKVVKVPVIVYKTKVEKVEIPTTIIAWKEPKQCTID